MAAALAEASGAAGAVIVLAGALGAGKTQFVKGFAEGLGVPADRVQSPTFVIAHELPLRSGLRLLHVDCYRVATEAELEAAGLFDWLAPDAIVVCEWGDRFPEAWPADRLEVRLERRGEEERELVAEARGPHAGALLEGWRAAWARTSASLARGAT